MRDNEAILHEISRIKAIVEEKLQVEIEVSCPLFSSKNSDGTWKYGEVHISYPTTGNSKINKLLKEEGYECRNRKVVDDRHVYDGYKMCTIATKFIELIY